MYIKSEGIVLRAVKYGDNSLIVDVYTLYNGCLPFLVRLPKGKKGSVRRLMFQPLTQIQFDADIRPRSKMYYFKEVGLGVAYHDLPLNIYKVTIALFLSEFLSHVLPKEGRNEPLYEFLKYALEWLDGCSGDFSNYHMVFLIKLSLFIGFFPNAGNYHRGDTFDLLNGCFSSIALPVPGQVLSAYQARFVVPLLQMNFDTMHHFRFNHAQRTLILEVIMDYYRLHVPGFPSLKSLAVLKEVFGLLLLLVAFGVF